MVSSGSKVMPPFLVEGHKPPKWGTLTRKDQDSKAGAHLQFGSAQFDNLTQTFVTGLLKASETLLRGLSVGESQMGQHSP